MSLIQLEMCSWIRNFSKIVIPQFVMILTTTLHPEHDNLKSFFFIDRNDDMCAECTGLAKLVKLVKLSL